MTDTPKVEPIHTVYVMNLPNGTADILDSYDETHQENSTYKQINAIKGVEVTEYYIEDNQNKIMFTIDAGLDTKAIFAEIYSKLMEIKTSMENPNPKI